MSVVSVALLAACLCAAESSAVPSGEGDPAAGHETVPRLTLDRAVLVQLLEEELVENKMPGLRAAVRLPHGEIVRAAVGLADVEASVVLDDEIGMPGGSTGKTFVAALTMLLVEEGTLSLEDPASRWLGEEPWFRRLPNAESIRVRHLLSHSAGLEDYPNTARFFFSMIGRALRYGSARYEPEELIGFVLERRPLFPAGEGFHYSDAGYLVLGRLIEAASGRSYFDLLEERILDPHGLDHVRPVRGSILTDVAIGYTGGVRAIKKDGRMKLDPSSEWTGGGLTTNPTMLVKFYGALAEGRVVLPESLQQMVHGGWHDPESPGLHYGFGLFVEDDGRSFGHGGLWPGYRTHVGHGVASNLTIAVQTNRDGRMDLDSLVRRIAKLVEPATQASPRSVRTEPAAGGPDCRHQPNRQPAAAGKPGPGIRSERK